MKVAIQGIKGSFHDKVASQLFGNEYNCTSCFHFSDVVASVEKGECDYGIIAIENSLAGTILENYRLLRNSYVEITAEHYLKIDHHLLALPGQQLGEIDTVLSHEMALKQCQSFLAKTAITNQQTYSDTASAAKHIAFNRIKGTASIGSTNAAKNYGLEILSHSIQDTRKNYTRFLIIEKPKTTGFSMLKNKATIIFSVLNEPGRLANVLAFLQDKKVNLSKIESVPHFNKLGAFDMITDLVLTDKQSFKTILPELYLLVEEIKVLGVYDKQIEPWN